MKDFQIEIDGVTQDDSLCLLSYSICPPPCTYCYEIGIGYGWFIAGWEDFSVLGNGISKEMLEDRIQTSWVKI
jgi:hypothetical protein